MHSKDKKKLSTEGGSSLAQSGLFGALDALQGQLPSAPVGTTSVAKPPVPALKKRGRVEIRRLKAGKGGKIVTEISHFAAISPQELEEFSLQLKKLCGVGGTCRTGVIELQGDQRDKAASWLKERGFAPVLAGG